MGGLACVVINPSKRGATPRLRAALAAELRAAGWVRVDWAATTPDQHGARQAARAVEAGAELVIAAGGDGTARAVADGVARASGPRAGVELGIVPLGTANLAARGLGIPLRRWPALRLAAGTAAHRVALIDLLRVSTDALEAAGAPPEPCLVVTGIGFDARLVAATRAGLKRHAGWGAYAIAAVRSLGSPRLPMRIAVDGGAREEARARAREEARARCLLIANSGRLPAGIRLLPDARMDDGALDVAALDVRRGLVGWASLARQVLPPAPARYTPPGRGLADVRLARGREAVVDLGEPAPLEIDGEVLAPARWARVHVEPGAVAVRVPRTG
ncbi:diacylglycerol/lipid kinase family protein [Actinomyces marmotae]|uniref:Diacylglycerol kinase n=1 Tax=Actinomyces marmotae TaxID=2737173 RepID=A0A6M8AX17_9ACTO|nr:diacylglycerol kinase family protein [Actinomyces marmotae]QKD78909.1 diacylglycerol kinase [Actinomyces marmotae]